jgi:acetylornithine deacetylase/succinyl-diaminopimelate desuccinylase-like protein
MTALRKIIGDDSIKVEVIFNFVATESPHKTRLMTAIDRVAKTEGARAVPTMITGFTDSHYFRQKGLTAYGFVPIDLAPGEENGTYGPNEHLSIKELDSGIRRMVELLKAIGGMAS